MRSEIYHNLSELTVKVHLYQILKILQKVMNFILVLKIIPTMATDTSAQLSDQSKKYNHLILYYLCKEYVSYIFTNLCCLFTGMLFKTPDRLRDEYIYVNLVNRTV